MKMKKTARVGVDLGVHPAPAHAAARTPEARRVGDPL
jgi:hypothetical protein